MPSLYVKNGSNWVHQSPPYVKNGTQWVIPKEIWVKNGGTWVKVFEKIPSNLIIMYGSTTHIPSNSTTWTQAHDWSPYGRGGGIGDTSGADTHSGIVHGFGTMKWNEIAHPLLSENKITPDGHSITQGGHQHGGGWTHRHDSTNTHAAEWRSLIPTYNVPYISMYSFFMHDGAISVPSWNHYSLTKYLRFRSDTSQDGGSASHTHGAMTALTTAFDATLQNNTDWESNIQYFYKSHRHYLNSNALLAVTNTNPFKWMRFYRLVSDIKIYNNLDIPSGFVSFCMNNTVPSGWSYYPALYKRIPRFASTQTGVSDVDDHKHNSAGDYFGGSYVISSDRRYYHTGAGSPDDHVTSIAAHTVNQYSTHPSDGTSVPKIINAYPVIKD